LKDSTVQVQPVIFTLPRCTSAELFFFCCDSVAAQPALANCFNKVDFTTAPPTPSALYTALIARKVGVGKPLGSHVRDTRARAIAILCFLCQTIARSFLRFSATTPPSPLRLFLPNAPAYRLLFLCKIVHMHAGQVLEGVVRRERRWRRRRALRRQRSAARPH